MSGCHCILRLFHEKENDWQLWRCVTMISTLIGQFCGCVWRGKPPRSRASTCYCLHTQWWHNMHCSCLQSEIFKHLDLSSSLLLVCPVDTCIYLQLIMWGHLGPSLKSLKCLEILVSAPGDREKQNDTSMFQEKVCHPENIWSQYWLYNSMYHWVTF